MNQDPHNDAVEEDEDVYDLDLEDDSDSDPETLMREALEAVDARVGARHHPEAESAETAQAASVGDAEAPTAHRQESERPAKVAGAASAELEEMSRRVQELEGRLAEEKDRALRALADYENFRRRTERSRQDEKRYAAEGVLRDCLQVVDNLTRALEADGDLDDLKRGVEMILKQIEGIMERAGVEPITAVGERFDPSVHEAVSRVEDDEVATATVVDEYQRGYTLHDRLLRAAMVVVAVPSESARNARKAARDEAGDSASDDEVNGAFDEPLDDDADAGS